MTHSGITFKYTVTLYTHSPQIKNPNIKKIENMIAKSRQGYSYLREMNLSVNSN